MAVQAARDESSLRVCEKALTTESTEDTEGLLPTRALVAVLRATGEGYSWDSLQVVEEFDLVPFCEQVCEGVALAVADFHHEPALWPEQLPCLRDEALVDVESGGSGVERGVRLEVADLRLEDFGFGDVGRVGDDGVEAFVCHGLEQVGFEESDSSGEIVAVGVLLGDG